MTTNELKDEVLSHQFSPQRYTANIYVWLDQGQKRVYRRSKLRTAQNAYDFITSADDRIYDVPADYASFDRLINTDASDLLSPIEQADFDDLPETSGTPSNYVINSGSIYLYPTPQGSINMRLRYWMLPPTLSSTVNPIIPADYDHLLVHYALKKCYEAEHDFVAAQYHATEFDNGLLLLQSETTFDSYEGPKQVKGSW